MFGFLKKIAKIVKGSVKLVKPFAGVAVLMVPGAAQAQAGLQLADNVVKAYNGKDPKKKAKANLIVAAQTKLATTHPNPEVRRQAENGLKLMAARAAALKTSKRYTVDRKGFVIRAVSGTKIKAGLRPGQVMKPSPRV